MGSGFVQLQGGSWGPNKMPGVVIRSPVLGIVQMSTTGAGAFIYFALRVREAIRMTTVVLRLHQLGNLQLAL